MTSLSETLEDRKLLVIIYLCQAKFQNTFTFELNFTQLCYIGGQTT